MFNPAFKQALTPTPDPAKILGDILTRFRIQRSMTRAEVAARVGVSTKRITHFEQGEDAPDSRTWARYSNMVAKGLRKYDDEWRAACRHTHACIATVGQAVRDAADTKPIEQDDEAAQVEEAQELPVVEAATSFPAALIAARQLAGLSQVELGELIDVWDSTISNWERGVVNPVIESFDKLVELLPALDRWRYLAVDMEKPPGFTYEDRLHTVIAPRAQIADAVSMAIANSTQIKAEPAYVEPRHDHDDNYEPEPSSLELLLQSHSAAILRSLEARKRLTRAQAALADAEVAVRLAKAELSHASVAVVESREVESKARESLDALSDEG